VKLHLQRAVQELTRLARMDRRDDSLVGESRSRVGLRLAGREMATTFTLGAAFLGVALGVLVAVDDRGRAGAFAVAVLLCCYAVAGRVQFEVGFATAVPTQLVFIPLLLLAPLRCAPLLVAAGFFLSQLPEHLRGEWHPDRIVLHLVSSWYAVGPVLVLAVTGRPDASATGLAIMTAALLAQFAFDLASSAARGCAGLSIAPRVLLHAVVPAWLVDLALTPIGLLLGLASLAHTFAFLLGLPLVALFAYFAHEREERIDNALELSHAYRGTALLLGDMVEADDAYTGLHSQDVVSLVLAVCEVLDLDADERRDAELTALLHDVGKVRIPKQIINKSGALTPQERAVINTHTIEGERMLETVGGLLARVGRIVRSCHEQWDGTGYPDGLAGRDIPLVARIVCACDAFSAMTTDRSYRRALPREAAVDQLRRGAGTQFDPRVVDALVAVADLQRPLTQAA
jgi:hypothetical protein